MDHVLAQITSHVLWKNFGDVDSSKGLHLLDRFFDRSVCVNENVGGVVRCQIGGCTNTMVVGVFFQQILVGARRSIRQGDIVSFVDMFQPMNQENSRNRYDQWSIQENYPKPELETMRTSKLIAWLDG